MTARVATVESRKPRSRIFTAISRAATIGQADGCRFFGALLGPPAAGAGPAVVPPGSVVPVVPVVPVVLVVPVVPLVQGVQVVPVVPVVSLLTCSPVCAVVSVVSVVLLPSSP